MPKSLLQHLTLLVSAWLMAISLGCAAAFSPEDVEQDIRKVRAGQYRLDKHHATMLFKVQHMGLAPYLGRFNDFDIQLAYDPENPAATRVKATVKTASIDVNYPQFSTTLSGADWFNSASFPEASFVSTGIEWRDASHASVSGHLTLLGVTAPVTLEVVFHGAIHHVVTRNYTLGFSATLAFERSRFGLDKFIPVVADRVEMEIHAELQRQ